jgi:hypothetical protein
MADEFNLHARGLSLLVDELEVFGDPPERLKIWGTLHYLPVGSPFCCRQPECHISLLGRHKDRVNDALRHRMDLRQPVLLELGRIASIVHDGVKFEHG